LNNYKQQHRLDNANSISLPAIPLHSSTSNNGNSTNSNNPNSGLVPTFPTQVMANFGNYPQFNTISNPINIGMNAGGNQNNQNNQNQNQNQNQNFFVQGSNYYYSNSSDRIPKLQVPGGSYDYHNPRHQRSGTYNAAVNTPLPPSPTNSGYNSGLDTEDDYMETLSPTEEKLVWGNNIQFN